MSTSDTIWLAIQGLHGVGGASGMFTLLHIRLSVFAGSANGCLIFVFIVLKRYVLLPLLGT